MSTQLDRIAEIAKANRKLRFTSLIHLITPEFLMETWGLMNKRGAAGVDGETGDVFGQNLEERCTNLVTRLKRGAYKAPPVRRVNIPKGEGKTRPLGIPTVEDRLLQRAVTRILEAIYEQDFLDCSYGFRPGRSPHGAIKVLRDHCMAGRVTQVFETDIRGFFNNICQKWLMRMLKLRIGDSSILRLIGKWLRAGVLVDGLVTRSEKGTPQGGPASPLLANIYLHYALDLWFEKRIKPFCEGKAYLTRFADDFVASFEYKGEAEFFQVVCRSRLGHFGLELADEKTGLHAFGRMPTTWGRPTGHFDFLGFSHRSRMNSKGQYLVVRIPTAKSCRKFLEGTKAWLKRFRHATRKEQREALTSKLLGFYRYFGLPHCVHRLNTIRFHVLNQWRRALLRQSQRSKATWVNLNRCSWFDLPKARVYLLI